MENGCHSFASSQQSPDCWILSLLTACHHVGLRMIASGSSVAGSIQFLNTPCLWNWLSCLCSPFFHAFQFDRDLSFRLVSLPSACSLGVVELDPRVWMCSWISPLDAAAVASPHLKAVMAPMVVMSNSGE